jgi:tetratricopeptide (TPR) repeat protein
MKIGFSRRFPSLLFGVVMCTCVLSVGQTQMQLTVDDITKRLKESTARDMARAREVLGAGQALMRAERYEEAVTEFRKHVDLSPPIPEARLSLVEALMAAGRFVEACDEARIGTKLGDGWCSPRYAMLCSRLGRDAEAIRTYREIIYATSNIPAFDMESQRIKDRVKNGERIPASSRATDTDSLADYAILLERNGQRGEAHYILMTAIDQLPQELKVIHKYKLSPSTFRSDIFRAAAYTLQAHFMKSDIPYGGQPPVERRMPLLQKAFDAVPNYPAALYVIWSRFCFEERYADALPWVEKALASGDTELRAMAEKRMQDRDIKVAKWKRDHPASSSAKP